MISVLHTRVSFTQIAFSKRDTLDAVRNVATPPRVCIFYRNLCFEWRAYNESVQQLSGSQPSPLSPFIERSETLFLLLGLFRTESRLWLFYRCISYPLSLGGPPLCAPRVIRFFHSILLISPCGKHGLFRLHRSFRR